MSGLPVLSEQNNKKEIVRRLQNGANVNEQDSNGTTALFVACQKNYTEIAEILLCFNKINVNLHNNARYSPFYYACSNNSYECVLMMLQDARVDVNLDDNYGISPFMWACYNGYTKTVQLLLSFGRNIDIHKKSTQDLYNIKGDPSILMIQLIS